MKFKSMQPARQLSDARCLPWLIQVALENIYELVFTTNKLIIRKQTISLDATPLLDGAVSITTVVADKADDNIGHLPAQN